MKPKKLPETLQKLGEQLKKYRYAALILLIGLVLLMIPTEEAEPVEEPQTAEFTIQDASVERRLEQLLCQVHGAGDVSVMLTVAREEERVYQTNETTEERQEESTVTVTTVLASSGSSEEVPLEVTVNGPVYLGAVVVAEGGDQPSVRLDLVNAVSSLTGLGADKITVIKMKAN